MIRVLNEHVTVGISGEKRLLGSKCRLDMLSKREYWICACGRVNRRRELLNAAGLYAWIRRVMYIIEVVVGGARVYDRGSDLENL